MPESVATTRKVRCPQCGAPLEVPLGATHLVCPYCGSAVQVETGIFQGEFIAKPVFDKAAATERFFRWTAERDKPAPFSEKVELLNVVPIWVPTWHIRQWKTAEGGGREISFSIEPAAKNRSEIAALQPENLPLQGLRPVEGELEGQKMETDFSPQEKITVEQSKGKELDQLLLVYVPLYKVDYAYKGRKYSLLMDAMTGGIHAKEYPKKAGWPFYLYTIAFGVVYLLTGIMLVSDDPVVNGLACAAIVVSIPVSALIAYILVKKV